MGSKKSKKPAAELSKKERKALEKKAEALRAELAEREAAKASKKGKKSKGEKPSKKAAKKRAEPLTDADEPPRTARRTAGQRAATPGI